MRLHLEKRSFASLGIREIAREAHLNPNTFYRHFESIDDIAVAAIEQIGERLRPMLHDIRSLASRVDVVSVAAIEVTAFFAFALANSDAFVIGVAEYHAGPPRVRAAIGELLNTIAAEMHNDIMRFGLFPNVPSEQVREACVHVVKHLFHLSQEYIEQVDRRSEILASAESFVMWMFAGAAQSAPGGILAAISNAKVALAPT